LVAQSQIDKAQKIEELCEGYNLLKKEDISITKILSNKAVFFACFAGFTSMFGNTLFSSFLSVHLNK
jgi:hypothetical protein